MTYPLLRLSPFQRISAVWPLSNIPALPTMEFELYIIELSKHWSILKNDNRRSFTLSSFGFYQGGSLKVYVKNFSITQSDAIKSNGSVSQSPLCKNTIKTYCIG